MCLRHIARVQTRKSSDHEYDVLDSGSPEHTIMLLSQSHLSSSAEHANIML